MCLVRVHQNRQELSSQSYLLRHRPHLFDALVTPTITAEPGNGPQQKNTKKAPAHRSTQNASTHHTNNKKIQKQNGTGRETLATTKSARKLKKKLAQMMNATTVAFSFDDDEERTTSHEDNLEDWIEHVKKKHERS